MQVDRVEVGAVGRPEVRRDERWYLTTQKLNRRTCPTNGEDVSDPVSELSLYSDCLCLFTFMITSEHDIANQPFQILLTL